MAGVKDDDPFTWDVDRVIKELCTPDRTWTPTANAKLPDPAQLANKLRETEYDGEVLLSSLDYESDLWSALAINAPKHRMAIRTAIRQFQARSRQYQEYKKSLQYHSDNDDISNNGVQSTNTTPSGDTTTLPPLSGHDNNQGNEELPKGAAEAVQNGSLQNGEASEPPLKKQRRLAPSQLMTIEQLLPGRTPFNTAPILTEADAITASRVDTQPTQPPRPRRPSENTESRSGEPIHMYEHLLSRPEAFFGNGKFSYDNIKELDPAVDDDRSFGFGRPLPLGRGRKNWVNGKMKRILLNRLPSDHDDDEPALPLFGDSDDNDNSEWDDIDREYAEELEEVRIEKEQALASASSLRPEDVDTCLREMVDQRAALWRETKLPKLQHKAFDIWKKAHRTGAIREVKRLSTSLLETNNRLEKMLENLKVNVYSNKRELLRMSPILEPTIDETERLKWFIEVVKGSEAPEKISPQKKPVSVPRRKPAASLVDGIDIWTDDELDDFIVEDHEGSEDGSLSLGQSRATGTAKATDASPAADISGPELDRSFDSTSDVTMYDLTQVGSSSKTPINLNTPVKSRPSHASPLLAGGASVDEHLPLLAIQDIKEKGCDYWLEKRDFERLLITIIAMLPEQRRQRLLDTAVYSTAEDLWDAYIVEAIRLQPIPLEKLPQDTKDKARRDNAILLARLFDIFTGAGHSCDGQPFDRAQGLTQAAVKRIEKQKARLNAYFDFLQSLAPRFGITSGEEDDDLAAVDADMADDNMAPNLASAEKKRRLRLRLGQDKSALLRREENKETQDKEVRRLLFRKNAQSSTQLPREKTRLVINESKLEGQGLVFVSEHIAPHIKNHQIAGVRFMWDEITKDTKHGCLLAHTMGLGKTMQVIALLTAIAEAAKSEDESISCQIPDHLKALKTLILVPSGILNNWLEELQRWAPDDVLGSVYYIDSTIAVGSRGDTIRRWGRDGGVLLMGYTLFRALPGKHDDLIQMLLNEPSLVIGDEAHNFKNQKASISKLANSFKTRSRIALTGSPLSNNVEEYFSMINWISPGFLGDSDEFTAKYGQPIKDGLWKDADPAVRRKAKIRLASLKQVVGPKVHRRTVVSLRDSGLPPKKEFLIYLDLTEIQKSVYQEFVQGVLAAGRNPLTGKLHVKSVWSLVSTLRLLLAHPKVLQTHLKKTHEDMARSTKALADSDDEAPNEPLPDGTTEVLSSTLETLNMQLADSVIDASYKMMVLDKILDETLSMGENILIFSQSIPSLDYVEQKLCREKQRAYERLDGSTPTASRQKMVNRFNEKKKQAFLISTTAGGVGLNIWGANRVIILDFKYNPLHEQQAIGRAYRMGQTKEVFVYWLLCDGTFERVMQNQQIFKNQLFSQVVDEKNPLPKADPNLKVWFKKYEQAPRRDTSIFHGQDPVLDVVLLSEELSGHISCIETTDTFEEEELDADLAADEQLEADRMVAEQTGKAASQPPPQSDQVRQLPVSSPSPPAALLIPQTDNSSNAADTEAAPEGDVLSALPPTAADRAFSESDGIVIPPSWANFDHGPASVGPPQFEEFPTDEMSQGSLTRFTDGAPRPAFSRSIASVARHLEATPQPVNPLQFHPYYNSVLPAQAQILRQPPHPFPALQDGGIPFPFAGTDAEQQQWLDPRLPGLSNQAATGGLPAPPPGLGSNGIEYGQTMPSNPVQMPSDPVQMPQLLPQAAATRPMMVGGSQNHRREGLPADFEARRILKAELSRNVAPGDTHLVEAALREMEQHVVGELPRRMTWIRLSDLLRINPACAAGIVNGRATGELVRRAPRTNNEELASALLGPAPKERDPNVGDHVS